MSVRAVNKHGRLGQLIDEKIDDVLIGNSQKRAQVAQSWPKSGEKGYLLLIYFIYL